MTKKLIKSTLIAVLSLFSLSSIFITTPTLAADPCSANLPEAVRNANGCSNSTTEDTLKNSIVNIINAVIGLLAVVAVVFIVVGGIQYMTSAGDTSKTQKAKNTILYALIGLVVCVLAFAIVNWLIGVIK